MKYLHYPLGIWHSHGKWPIEIDGLPIQNDDFPWQTVSHNQMVSHHEYTLRPGRASWTSHIPWSLALSEYMEPLNGGQSGGINSGWSSWYWLVYGYNWLYLYVSICIYMYLYVSICIYMYLYVSICIYMHLYASICIHIHGRWVSWWESFEQRIVWMSDSKGEEVTETVPANIWKGDMRAHRMQIGKNMLDWNLVLQWIPPHFVIFLHMLTLFHVILCHFMSFYSHRCNSALPFHTATPTENQENQAWKKPPKWSKVPSSLSPSAAMMTHCCCAPRAGARLQLLWKTHGFSRSKRYGGFSWVLHIYLSLLDGDYK